MIGRGHQRIAVPAYPVEAVDTTGAGDSFSTAFLVAYMHTEDVVWSARFGAAVVITVIERTGGVQASRMPTREEVDQRLEYESQHTISFKED